MNNFLILNRERLMPAKALRREKWLLVCFLTYASSLYSATSTTTFTVSATVLSNCLVSASPHAFGNYDPTTGSNVNGTSTITVTCTQGTPYDIGLDAGTGTGATVTTRKMTRVGGSDLLNYSLYQDNSRTIVWGNTIGTNTEASSGTGLAQSFTIYGQIPGSQVIPAAVYNDTITITITY